MQTTEFSTTAMHSDNQDLISSERVKGTAVYDSSEEKIGTIDELMLSKTEGKVAYAVMSFGGFLGIGEKFHPLPWDSLDYDTTLGGYRVGMAGETFREAPSYSREDIDRSDWHGTTDSYYGDRTGDSGLMGRDRRI